jgi:uncharacterized protein
MSQENVEIVRGVFEAMNRGGVAAAADLLDPEIEYLPSPMWPEASVYKGHDEMREFESLWTKQFDEYRLDLERTVDAGDHVLALSYQRGCIKGSTDQIEQPVGHDCEVRDGKVTRIRTYLSWAQALKAVGLEE